MLFKSLRAASLVLAISLSAAACAPTTEIHGNMIRPMDLDAISVGRDTRASVVARIGNPSTVSNFEDSSWYYIGQRSEQTAFFEPEIIERQIVIVEFGGDGRVSKIEKLDLTHGLDVALVDRETPTAGQEITVIQQLLGNVGRFTDTLSN